MISTLPPSLIETAKTLLESVSTPLNWAHGKHYDKATPRNQYDQDNHKIIFVDGREVIEKTDPSFRVSPDEKTNHIGDRMQRAIDHFRSGKYMDLPMICSGRHPQEVGVADGRHRIAAAVKMGQHIIPVIVAKEDIKHLSTALNHFKASTGNPSDAMPYADISHHRKPLVNEGHIDDWASHYGLYSAHHAIKDPYPHLANAHIGNLMPHEFKHVSHYIQGGLNYGDETGSRRINEQLLQSHKHGMKPPSVIEYKPNDEEESEFYFNINHMDQALSRNKLEHPLKTYSGLSFNPGKILDSSGHLFLPAYTSSSTIRPNAMGYAESINGVSHILEIRHPVGSTGCYVGDRDDVSPFYDKEHIMPRNTLLRVNKNPTIHHDDNGNEYHIWKSVRVLNKEQQ